jgi:hypothetical protein
VLNRFRSRLSVMSLVVMLSAGFGAFAPPASATTITTPATAAFYGDSILFEARDVVASQFAAKAGWTITVNSYPAAAVCDWQSTLESDLAALHPKIVVLETFGVSLTPCMNGLTRGSTAWADKYRADIDTFFRTATSAGAKVLFVKPVVIDSARVQSTYGVPFPNSYQTTLTSIATSEAKLYHGVSVTAAPKNSLLTSTGAFTYKKTCLAGETAAMGCVATTNKITVRNPDGVHLCPVAYGPPDGMLAGCPAYASGAVRYGKALATATVSPPAPLLP